MGLDSVELLIACEEEFDVLISDDEAEKCITPRILGETIFKRLRTVGNNICPSQRGFYHVRNALIRSSGVGRNDISPDVPLERLISTSQSEFWKKLENELSIGPLPRLEFSKNAKYILFYFVPAAFSVALYYKGIGISYIALILLLYSILMSNLNYKYGYVIPDSFQSVKDLIPLVGSMSNKIWSKEDVLDNVMLITCEQTGLKLSDFTLDSHYIDEIGLD